MKQAAAVVILSIVLAPHGKLFAEGDPPRMDFDAGINVREIHRIIVTQDRGPDTPRPLHGTSVSGQATVGLSVGNTEVTDDSGVNAILEPGSERVAFARCSGEGTPRSWGVCLTARIDNPLGHSHIDGMPEVDILDPACKSNIPGNTTVNWRWRVPQFASRITGTATFTGWCRNTTTSTNHAMVPNLVDLGPGEGYDLKGTDTAHPHNHFVAAPFKTALKAIGKAWRQACPQSAVLLYNDMSLPQGGLFDINQDWSVPHKGHRFGTNADVSKKWVRKGNRKKLIKIMCDHAIVQSEGDAPREGPHFHLTAKNSVREEDYDDKIVPCCDQNRPMPQECIDLGSGHSEVLPEEPDC